MTTVWLEIKAPPHQNSLLPLPWRKMATIHGCSPSKVVLPPTIRPCGIFVNPHSVSKKSPVFFNCILAGDARSSTDLDWCQAQFGKFHSTKAKVVVLLMASPPERGEAVAFWLCLAAELEIHRVLVSQPLEFPHRLLVDWTDHYTRQGEKNNNFM